MTLGIHVRYDGSAPNAFHSHTQPDESSSCPEDSLCMFPVIFHFKFAALDISFSIHLFRTHLGHCDGTNRRKGREEVERGHKTISTHPESHTHTVSKSQWAQRMKEIESGKGALEFFVHYSCCFRRRRTTTTTAKFQITCLSLEVVSFFRGTRHLLFDTTEIGVRRKCLSALSRRTTHVLCLGPDSAKADNWPRSKLR